VGTGGTGGDVGTGGAGGDTGTGGTTGTGGAAGGNPSSSMFQLDGVATWRNNAKAAYTIIHDDTCDTSAIGEFEHADPILTAHGLHGTFGANPGTCDSEKRWDKVKTLADHGHDVINHDFNHYCIGDSCASDENPTMDFATQIDKAHQELTDHIGHEPRYFIFPYDSCGSAAISHLKSKGYLGARCGSHGLNATNFADAFKTQFDVWGPNWSIYLDAGPCSGKTKPDEDTPPTSNISADCRMYVLNHFVDDAIAKKGWANREMHGFDGDDGAFQPVSVGDYTAHLDYVKTKVDAGDLWMDGATQVVKYRFARDAGAGCALPTVSGNTLKFGAPSAGCTKYATVLSYLVSTTDNSDPATLKVVQGGTTLPARKLSAGKFVVDADPTKGDAVLSE
jgi:peptidoglycan/xylan/chitin deacetylase (PgdA/CDA1 family)